MGLIMQMSSLIGSAEDIGVCGSLMTMFLLDTCDSDLLVQDPEVLILTCTTALSPASCISHLCLNQ